MKDALSRFEDKYIENDNGCWVWQACVDKEGYGRFWYNKKTWRAHRFSYQYYKGVIRHTIDHLCKNVACVNPDHLEDVTIRENILRGDGIAAQNAAKQTCKKGHRFDEIIYRTDGRPERYCRQCRNEYMKHYMRKVRANERTQRTS